MASARYRQLKPRPGGSGQDVAEHQRGRIIAATIDLVDERGYEALTVAGIVSAAGVSKHTFYENFRDKEECFLATYDLVVRQAIRGVLAARARESGWRARMRAGFHAFAREVAGQPAAARLALIGALGVGGNAIRARRRTNGLFEALVTESFAEIDDGATHSPLLTRAIVAGVARVARARLLAGEEQRLPGEADELIGWVLSMRECPLRPDLDQGSPGRFRERHRVAATSILGGGPVPGDERSMILAATARLAAADGYGSLTVTRIRTTAGVSRRRFDQQFESVSDCFLAALELLVEEAIGDAAEALSSAPDWPTGVCGALDLIFERFVEDPALAKLAFVELCAPGEAALRWRGEILARLATGLVDGAPADRRPAAIAAEASIGAVAELAHHLATTSRPRQILAQRPLFAYILLAPSLGSEAAILATSTPIGDQERFRSIS
jgi:AcrR family transcriptional regulator